MGRKDTHAGLGCRIQRRQDATLGDVVKSTSKTISLTSAIKCQNFVTEILASVAGRGFLISISKKGMTQELPCQRCSANNITSLISKVLAEHFNISARQEMRHVENQMLGSPTIRFAITVRCGSGMGFPLVVLGEYAGKRNRKDRIPLPGARGF